MPTNMLAPYGQPEKPAPGSGVWDWAKYALQHPGGDVIGTDLMTLTKRLPPALLRKALTLQSDFGVTKKTGPRQRDWVTIPGKRLSEDAMQGLRYLQDALYQYGERYPRVMSHFKAWVDPRGTPDMPNMPPTQAEFRGRELGSPASLVKNLDPHKQHANITFYPAGLELIKSPIDARKLVRHEVGHGTQWVADPSRFNQAYDNWMDAASESAAGGYISNPAEKLSRIGEVVEEGRFYGSKSFPKNAPITVENTKRARREWAKARSGIARHPNEPVETRRGASRIYGPPGED
jgi:hypothetical protein